MSLRGSLVNHKIIDHNKRHLISTSNRTLCVGFNYPGTSMQLGACTTDAKEWFEYFISKQEPNDATILLTDDNGLIPLTELKRAIDWLFSSATINDYYNDDIKNFADKPIAENVILTMTYSGHGSSQTDHNGDEIDGVDEVIVAYNGFLSDDELNKFLTRMIPSTSLEAYFDSCNSGTILDLQYVMETPGSVKKHAKATNIKGRVFCISGCRDPNYSYELGNNGALTYLLLEDKKKYIRSTAANTQRRLISKMRSMGLDQSPVISSNIGMLYGTIQSLY
jgi:hypothetical protein